MKQKNYLRPTMEVVQLQHRGILMTSGEPTSVNAQRSSYGTATDETWE